jgi:hypothetical protein
VPAELQCPAPSRVPQLPVLSPSSVSSGSSDSKHRRTSTSQLPGSVMPRSRYVQSPINVQYSLLAVVLAQPVGVHVHTLFNSGHCSWSYHLRATDPPPGTTIGRAKITPTRNSIARSRKQQIFPAEFPRRQRCEQCGWARQSVPRPKQLTAAQCTL